MKLIKTRKHEITPYKTKDGSEILELMHPAVNGNQSMSFAQATVEPGRTTILHKHRTSEEIYHVVQGTGKMSLDNEHFSIRPGDTICILPNQLHCIENIGNIPLVIYCCCAPPYSHEDTELIAK